VGSGDADFRAVDQRDARAASLRVIHEPATRLGVVGENRVRRMIEHRVAIEGLGCNLARWGSVRIGVDLVNKHQGAACKDHCTFRQVKDFVS